MENYAEISKETFSFLYKSYTSLKHSALDATLRVLTEIRVSQINGCAYCCKQHTDEAHKLGIPQEKINQLADWSTSTVFSDQERAAFKWAEDLTYLKDKNLKATALLKKFFLDKEIVDLTACISIMNALNRIAISLRDD